MKSAVKILHLSRSKTIRKSTIKKPTSYPAPSFNHSSIRRKKVRHDQEFDVGDKNVTKCDKTNFENRRKKSFQCDKCDFITEEIGSFKGHKETNGYLEGTTLYCDKCYIKFCNKIGI